MNTLPRDLRPAATALLPPRRSAPNIWLDLAFVLVTAVLILLAVLTQSIMLSVFLVLPVLYILLFILVRRPVWAFAFALVVQHFSGLIKQLSNWTQTGYVVQDVTFLLVLVPLVLRRVLRGAQANRTGRAWTSVDTLIVLFFALNFLCTFNPESPSPWLLLAAVRVRLLPLLMYFFVLQITREDIELERPLFYVMAVCTLCGALFSIYESHIGIAGVQALGPGFWPKQLSRVWQDAQGTQHFRPPGIYSDAGIAVAVAGMFAFLALLRNNARESLPMKVFIYGCLIFAVAEVLVTGSRSGFLAVAAGFVFLVLWKRSRVLTAALVGLPIVIGIVLLVQPKIFDRYSASIINPGQAYAQNRGSTNQVAVEEMKRSPLGYGTGTATEGVSKVADLLGVNSNTDSGTLKYDNGWSNLLHEMGIPGALVYLALLIAIFGYALHASKILPPGKKYLAATLVVWSVVVFVSTLGFIITDAFPVNVYFWSLTALVVGETERLRADARQKRAKTAALPEPRQAVLAYSAGENMA